VFVTGCSTGSGVYCHYATLAYSGAGVPLWTNRYNGSDNNDAIAVAMAVDRHGGVFVTGYSYHSGQVNADYATVKYSSSVPPVLLDFQRLNDRLVLSWTNARVSLQSAPAATGTFTNVLGATSPYTNSLIGPQKYFRLAAP